MTKDFISYDIVRNNALKLAHKIATDGFIPDVIYASLRGGAYIGNVISEYFKLIRKNERPAFYAAVVARSYTDIRQQGKIRVDGWTYSPDHLRHGDKVLLVDDIFDSGKTVNFLAEVILDRGVPRDDLKIAVHDYKEILYKDEKPEIIPDYYCRKHVIPSAEKEIWIHYMSHELVGLTHDEIEKNYTDPEVREILKSLVKG